MNTFNQKSVFKKIVSFLVVICMMLGSMPSLTLLTVNAETPAENTADLWDGTTDTSWYNDYDTEFIIYTAEELAGLAYLVNNGNTFGNKTIHLGNDIDLAGREWVPIGKGTQQNSSWEAQFGYFAGNFNGDYYTVSNVSITNNDTSFSGLFGALNGATVENLNVDNVYIDQVLSYRNNCGGIAGAAERSTIRVCSTNVEFGGTSTSNPASFGGLLGLGGNSTQVENCYAIVDIEGGGHCAGLVGGTYSGSLTIVNCYVRGDIVETGEGNSSTVKVAAGFTGCDINSVDISDSFFSGTVTSSSSSYYFSKEALVSNCYHNYSTDASNFQSQSWIESNLGWDFDTVWEFREGDYPVLQGFGEGGYTPHVHSYEETSRTEATCTADGEIIRTCILCERIQREIIPAIDHNYVSGICTVCGECIVPVTGTIVADSTASVQIDVAGGAVYYEFVPTCSGLYQFYSSNNADDTYGALLDENGIELVRNDDGGNGSNFSITYDCVANTTYYIKAYFYSSSSTGSYTLNVYTIELYCDHDYVLQSTTMADCDNDGVATYVCSKCNDSYDEVVEWALGHDYVLQSTTTADCVSNGVEVYACTRCGDSYEDIYEYAYGHSYENGYCVNCGEYIFADAMVVGSDESVYVDTTGYVCFQFTPTVSGQYRFYSTDYSGDPYAELYDANGNCLTSNDDGGEGWNFSIDYDCEANQTYYIRAYNYDGYYSFNTETIEIYCDHNYVLQSSTEADCTNDGIGTYVCTLCNDSYIEVITPKLGHNYIDSVCTRCGAVRGGKVLLVEDIFPWGSYANSATLQRLVDAGVIEGYDKYSSYDLAVGNVDMYDYSLVILAADQEQSFYNNIPIDTLAEYAQSGGSVFLAADTAGHTSGTYYSFPFGITSVRNSYDRNYIVDNTHPMITGIYSNNRVLQNDDMYGSSISHNYFTNYPDNTNVILTDGSGMATLIEFEYGQGLVVVSGLTFECAYSNNWPFFEGYDDILIHLYNYNNSGYHTHTFTETSRTEATCTTDGRINYICECGATRVEIVRALGHNIESIVEIQVTCTTDGLIVDRCTNDGCNYERSTVIHGSHNYSITDRQDAACDTDGYIEYTCANCGDQYYEYFEGMHNYVESSRIEAQVDVEGRITYTCTYCSDSYSIVIPALTPVLKNSSVLLIQDALPWADDVNTALLEALKERGVVSSYNIINTSALATIDLSQYGVVFIANDQSSAMYQRLAANADKLENYVRAGGNLIYGACDEGWSGGSLTHTLPGGVTSSNYYSVHNYIVNELHPIVTGIYTDNRSLRDELLKGNYCSHTYFDRETLPEGTDIILRDANGNPTLIEYALGDGIVIATGLTWEYFYVRDHYDMVTNYSKYAFDDLLTYMVYMSSSCEHNYELVETVAPTCEENGYTLYVCTLCSYEYKSDIVMTPGHTPGEWIEDVPASCAPGSKHIECTVCGETIETEEIAPSGSHTFIETSRTEATCTTDGRINYICECGATRVEIVRALGHNIESIVEIQVTCTTDGLIVDRCTNDGCNYERSTVIHGSHNYSITDRQDAACDTDGYIEYTCANCGDQYYEYFEGMHNYVESSRIEAQVDVEGRITYTCTYCSDSYSIVIPALTPVLKNSSVLLIQDALPWADDVNTALLEALKERGVVSSYNIINTSALATIDLSQYGVVFIANDQSSAMYQRLAANADKLENYVRAGGNLIYGACDEGWSGGSLTHTLPGGVTSSNYYSVHNYIVNELHPIVTGIYTDNRSLRDELLKGNYCSHTYFDRETLPEGTDIILRDANGNPTLIEYALGDGIVIATGLTWEYFYVRDHYDMVTNYSKYAFDDLLTYMVYMSSSCEHNYELVETVAPTCEENGYTLYVCELCSYEYKADIIAPLGHNYAETSRTEATCINMGEIVYTCACGDVKIEQTGYAEHIPSDWIVLAPATCVAGIQYKECLVCHEGVESEEIPPVSDHIESDWIVDIEPTEVQTGSSHRECTECHTVLETKVIPSLAKIVISNVEAEAGSIVRVTIDIQNTPGIRGAALTLNYNPALTLINAEAGIAWSSLSLTKPSVFANSCTFVWDGMTADYSNGTILVLTFAVPEDADMGMVYDISASYTYGNMINGNLETIDIQIENGSITVADLIGDVNDDGIVNVVDVITLRRYIAGGYNVVIDEVAADINSDGYITVLDIVLLRSLLVG